MATAPRRRLVRLPRLKRLLLAGFAVAASAVACAAAPEGPLVVERSIALSGVTGRIDHMAVDLKRRRLFVAEVGAGGLDQIDLATGARLHRVKGLEEPQGVAYLADLDQVVLASGGDGTVRFYSGEGLEPVGLVQLEGDADNVRRDASTGLLVVADGSGLALIDPKARTLVGQIAMGAHPEGFQIDPKGGRAYVNIPSQRRIAVADLASRRVTASWSNGGLLMMNFPLALSPEGVVASVFRAPARLLTIDAATGRRTTNAPSCGDSDDAHFDAKRGRLYVTCGAGAVETFACKEGGYGSLGRTATRSGARTALFVPELDRLFVAARAGDGSEAAVLVLRPQD